MMRTMRTRAACAPHSSIWPSLPDPGKLILLLGEMRELGPESEAAHREIYGLAARLFPGARIVTVGDGFRNAGGGEHFASAADARPGDGGSEARATSFLPRGRAGSASKRRCRKRRAEHRSDYGESGKRRPVSGNAARRPPAAPLRREVCR